MPRNMSNNDRLFRLVMFVFILTLAIAWESWFLLAVSAIPLITSVIGFCPLYAITHYQTYNEAS